MEREISELIWEDFGDISSLTSENTAPESSAPNVPNMDLPQQAIQTRIR